MPVVLFFLDFILGIMFAYLTYDNCGKYPVNGLIKCIKNRKRNSKFLGLLQATAAVIGLVLCFPLILSVLIVEALIIWVVLYAVFTIPCIILYAIVIVRKQFVWQVEEVKKPKKKENEDIESGPKTLKERTLELKR